MSSFWVFFLHYMTYLFISTTLLNRYDYYPHFIDKEIQACIVKKIPQDHSTSRGQSHDFELNPFDS
jgi:hypothetical protein